VGNGLDFKMGVFDTIIGYEVFENCNNPNFTHSYGYTIEPTTHTGLLMSYQFADWLSASAGVANTVGPLINGRAFLGGGTTMPPTGQGPEAESYKTYMGSVTLTAPADSGALAGSTLSAGVINGFSSSVLGASGHQTSTYVGATYVTPVKGLKVGASYDYLAAGDRDPSSAGYGFGYANATALYASMQLSEKLTLYARGEYATTDYDALLGAGKVVSGTATLQYDLWKNVLSRLEFRWDHAADGSEPYGGTTTAGGLKNSYILAANVVYKF
jgi:hypothetical protein